MHINISTDVHNLRGKWQSLPYSLSVGPISWPLDRSSSFALEAPQQRNPSNSFIKKRFIASDCSSTYSTFNTLLLQQKVAVQPPTRQMVCLNLRLIVPSTCNSPRMLRNVCWQAKSPERVRTWKETCGRVAYELNSFQIKNQRIPNQKKNKTREIAVSKRAACDSWWISFPRKETDNFVSLLLLLLWLCRAKRQAVVSVHNRGFINNDCFWFCETKVRSAAFKIPYRSSFSTTRRQLCKSYQTTDRADLSSIEETEMLFGGKRLELFNMLMKAKILTEGKVKINELFETKFLVQSW